METGQGVCQWCGKLATCQTTPTHALRSFKSRSNGRKRQAQSHGNGYDHLDGQWLTYYKVASRFEHKVKVEDRQDLLHTIIANLADMEHKPFTESVMYRIASRTVSDYWFSHYSLSNGLDCRHCSTEQRRKCKEDWLYRDCPKAIKLESLNRPIVDDDGHTTELGNLIADDGALDLAEWLDIKTFLLGCPQRLIAIAQKRQDGVALTQVELNYLSRWRKREQIKLF
ncbi:MAG: hypothetical protein Q7R57_10390 [Dehalococcoidales bacterium]|nr:hypothetical protein [Dehalococcoidales bacterium]